MSTINYLKHKEIIDFLVSFELIVDNPNKLSSPLDYFVFGYSSLQLLKVPNKLQEFLESFLLIDEYYKAKILSQSLKNAIYFQLMTNAFIDVGNEIFSTMETDEEEKISNNSNINEKNEIDKKLENMNIFDKIDTLLTEYYMTNEPQNYLTDIDIGLFGFLIHKFKIKLDDLSQFFERYCSIRQAECACLMNYNQKIKVYIKLYNDINLDLNNVMITLMEKPLAGAKPLIELTISNEALNKISNLVAEQMVLE